MKILCFGDSLTYGFGLPREQVWTALAAQKTGAAFINCAINGNTTGGMLAAFNREVEAAYPDAVFLMGGVNDIIYGGDIAGARANMGAMVHMSYAGGMLPILGVPTGICLQIREDWASFINFEEMTRCSAEYVLWLRSMSRTFGVPLIDFNMELPRRAAQMGGNLRDYYLEDGLHPNWKGHQILAEIAADAVNHLLQ